MAAKVTNAAKEENWFQKNFNGLLKRFADEDPVKEEIKGACKLDPIYCLPSDECVGDLFAIGELLGEGTFGTVYSAIRNADKKLVALKYMKSQNIGLWTEQRDTNEEEEPMEVHILKKMKNIKGVVALLDVFMTPDSYVLVLDQPPPPTKNLCDYAQGKLLPITEKQARNIVEQVIAIMIEVQGAGVYHQDLKHENLLIETKTENIHLIDFGSAMLESCAPFDTFFGTEICKPREMLLDGVCDAEPSTVWSIGVLAYRIMTALPPFRTDQDIEAIKPEFTRRISTDLRSFISECFTSNPSMRPTLAQLSEHRWIRNGKIPLRK